MLTSGRFCGWTIFLCFLSFWTVIPKLLIIIAFWDILTLRMKKYGMVMVIQSKEYLDKLIAFKDKQLIKVVTGILYIGTKRAAR